METKITIRDIANYANVGTTTVSRVLNDHPYVSEDKRQRVLSAIDELNYRPSQIARRLRGSRSGLIGLLTEDVATTPYAVEIVKGAQEAAWEQDMVLLVADSNRNRDSAEVAIELLLERGVEGIIYATMYHHSVILPDNLKSIPTVLANCFLDDASLPAIVPDEVQGGFDATQILIQSGHTRIGFVNLGPTETELPPPTPAMTGRLEGYRTALETYGIPFDPSLVTYTNQTPQENHRIFREMLESPNRPTAFFCGNDRVAMSCYSVVLSFGLSIPEDIAIVGFDNHLDIAEGLWPQLTTVQLPHYEMGKQAVENLLSNQTTTHPIQHKITCPLVIRDSI
jgi:LacI family transcriptional regulator